MFCSDHVLCTCCCSLVRHGLSVRSHLLTFRRLFPDATRAVFPADAPRRAGDGRVRPGHQRHSGRHLLHGQWRPAGLWRVRSVITGCVVDVRKSGYGLELRPLPQKLVGTDFETDQRNSTLHELIRLMFVFPCDRFSFDRHAQFGPSRRPALSKF